MAFLGKLIRRAAADVVQLGRNLMTDVDASAKVKVLRHQVIGLEARLYRMERTGQKVESREMKLLRRELASAKKDLATWENVVNLHTAQP